MKRKPKFTIKIIRAYIYDILGNKKWNEQTWGDICKKKKLNKQNAKLQRGDDI